jgi:hypothetical protein
LGYFLLSVTYSYHIYPQPKSPIAETTPQAKKML